MFTSTLIVIACCIVFPVVIGYAYGRNQTKPIVDPDWYTEWND
jgi:hypothetical protein